MITLRQIHSLDDKTAGLIERLVASIDGLTQSNDRVRSSALEVSISTSILASTNNALKESIAFLAETIGQLSAPSVIVIAAGQSIHIPGLKDFQGEDMSTYSGIPRDHQDEPFVLDPIVIGDSEGALDIPFTETLESDNPEVVSIVEGSFHFGTFGNATVSRKATFTPPGEAEITVNAGSAVFNVVPGAITVRGSIQVPGLTPDPEAPAPE